MERDKLYELAMVFKQKDTLFKFKLTYGIRTLEEMKEAETDRSIALNNLIKYILKGDKNNA